MSDADRLTIDDLDPEISTREAQQVLLALLDLTLDQQRAAAEHNARGVPPTITAFDSLVAHLVLVLRDTGARPAAIIDTLEAPRRSVRTSLLRLEDAGLLMRDEGIYHPTKLMGRRANERWPAVKRRVSRLSRAWQDFDGVTNRA